MGVREILFRGKSSTTDEWVYGAFIPDAVESAKGMDFPVGYIIWYNGQTGHMERATVERSTVGQYTGYRDKNGKKIFEGDIIKLDLGGSWDGAPLDPFRCEVLWVRGGWRIKEKDRYSGPLERIEMYMEVIGTIHDNAEPGEEAEEP